MPQQARADLSRGRALRVQRSGVRVHATEGRREHARGETQLAHRQDHERRAGKGFGQRQHAGVVGGLARGGDDLVGIRRKARHALQQRVQGRRGFEVVIRDDDLRAPTKGVQLLGARFRALDFQVDSLRSRVHRKVEKAQLFLDAAIKFSLVLMAAAGGQDDAIAVLFQNFADDFDAAFWIFQIIEAEFKESFTRVGFAPRVFQQFGRVWEP